MYHCRTLAQSLQRKHFVLTETQLQEVAAA